MCHTYKDDYEEHEHGQSDLPCCLSPYLEQSAAVCHICTIYYCFLNAPEGFSLEAFLPMSLYRYFCSACGVTVRLSFSDTWIFHFANLFTCLTSLTGVDLKLAATEICDFLRRFSRKQCMYLTNYRSCLVDVRHMEMKKMYSLFHWAYIQRIQASLSRQISVNRLPPINFPSMILRHLSSYPPWHHPAKSSLDLSSWFFFIGLWRCAELWHGFFCKQELKHR